MTPIEEEYQKLMISKMLQLQGATPIEVKSQQLMILKMLRPIAYLTTCDFKIASVSGASSLTPNEVTYILNAEIDVILKMLQL